MDLAEEPLPQQEESEYAEEDNEEDLGSAIWPDIELDQEDVEQSQAQSEFESVEPQENLDNLDRLVEDARSRIGWY